MTQSSSNIEDRRLSENSIVSRTVLISAIILAAIFIALQFLEDNLSHIFGKYADEAVTALRLLSLWLVVSSAIRSINNLSKNISFLKLLLAGIFTSGISALLFVVFLMLFPNVEKSPDNYEKAGASGFIILVLMGIGFIVSLMAIINVRVRNRSLGNVLEFLIIAACILGFVYFAK